MCAHIRGSYPLLDGHGPERIILVHPSFPAIADQLGLPCGTTPHHSGKRFMWDWWARLLPTAYGPTTI